MLNKSLVSKVAVVGAFVLAAGSALAWRGGPGRGPESFKSRLLYRIGEAVDSVEPLTADQKREIGNIIDNAAEQMRGRQKARRAMLDRASTLFEADTIDTDAVAKLRAEHRQQAEAMADTVTEALEQLHDVLTPKQRQAVANELREMAEHHGPGGWRR